MGRAGPHNADITSQWSLTLIAPRTSAAQDRRSKKWPGLGAKGRGNATRTICSDLQSYEWKLCSLPSPSARSPTAPGKPGKHAEAKMLGEQRASSVEVKRAAKVPKHGVVSNKTYHDSKGESSGLAGDALTVKRTTCKQRSMKRRYRPHDRQRADNREQTHANASSRKHQASKSFCNQRWSWHVSCACLVPITHRQPDGRMRRPPPAPMPAHIPPG